MQINRKCKIVAAIFSTIAGSGAFAECVIPESSKKYDPVEVGYCEADAVFVAKVSARMETARAFRPEGEERTMHYRTETSTATVSKRFKGDSSAAIKLVAELYDKGETYSFAINKEYLVFGKKLEGEGRFSGATEKCSVQPTLLLSDAAATVEKLEQIKKGRLKIDCKNLRPKSE